MWTSYYFTKEAKLSGGNHVHNTWNVIEHLTNLLVANVTFLNLHYGDVVFPGCNDGGILQVSYVELVGVTNYCIPTVEGS
jgi:hypothetical protein